MKSKKILYQQIMETISQSVIGFIESLDWTLNESHDSEADDFIAGVNRELREVFESLNEGKKRETYWTEEKIRQYVKDNNIKTRIELLNKNKSIYNVAYLSGILNDLFGEPLHHHWTKEECQKLAQKCKFRSEFQEKYRNAYAAAKRNNWLDDITKHMPHQKGEKMIQYTDYVVYVYEDLKNKAAYVGLTRNIKRRDYEHRFPKNDGYDSLGIWCIEHNIPVPYMKIIKKNLSASDARKFEIEFWHQYKNDGWHMINSEKTLGYIGSSHRIWTKNAIIKFVSEHPEIDTRQKLRKAAIGAYNNALTYDNLLYDLFGDKTYKNWTKDRIEKLVRDNNIKSRYDLLKISVSAYDAANRLKLLDELFGDKKYTYWNANKIRKFVSEHPEIKTRSDFEKISSTAYRKAKELGLDYELFGDKQIKEWNEDNIYQFVINNNIKTRKQLNDLNSSAYCAARRLNLLDDLFGEHNVNHWTKKTIIDYVKQNNINSRNELYLKSRGAYSAALRLQMLDELFGELIHWNEKTIREYVLNNNISSRKELSSKSSAAYKLAKQLNILDDLFGEKTTIDWSEENIRKFIKQHPEIKSRKDLENASSSAYLAAKRKGLLDELFGQKLHIYWDEDKIKELLNKHPEIKNRTQLQELSNRAYLKAKEIGLLDKLFPINK